MDSLYKIIKQLSEEEFQDIYQNLTSNKAEKSALFLETIRSSTNPVEDFLEKQDISASAFYVLKSRLNQKVEDYLLNRLGDPKMEAIHKVFKIYELIFTNPREISVKTLQKLEKTMLEMDNPSVLMTVYRGLKMLHSYDDDERARYEKEYNQAVAFYLTTEKAIETVMNFFRVYDRYYLGRREKDLNELIRLIEKVNNINNLYASQRLYICKAIVHLFAVHFLELPDRLLEILDKEEDAFQKSFEILEKNPDDILFKNLNLIFDYLRYCYYSKTNDVVKEQIYFDLLDYKIEDLLTGYNFGMDCSQILFYKFRKHHAEGTKGKLNTDLADHISKIQVDSYRLVTYVNYNLLFAYAAFYEKKYENAARILYRIRNEVNFRKSPHADLEIKLFLGLCYVLLGESDLANQLILSLQRQLKKSTFSKYEQGRTLSKILTNRLGGKTAKKAAQLRLLIDEFNGLNRGPIRILDHMEINYSLFTDS